MINKFFNSLFNAIGKANLRYPYLCLGAAIVFTIISVFFIMKLSLDSSLTNLLPDEYESVKNAKHVLKETGGTDRFIILIKSKDLKTNLRYSAILKDKISLLPEFKQVFFKKNKEFFLKNSLLYLKQKELKKIYKKLKKHVAKSKLKSSPFFFSIKTKKKKDPAKAFKELDKFLDKVELTNERKYFYDESRNTIALSAIPYGSANNVKLTRKLYSLLLAEIEKSNPQSVDPSIEIAIGGTSKNKIDEYHTIISDITSTAILVGVLVMIVLALYYRNFFAIFFITIPLLMSIFWTFGIAQVAIGKLNTFTGFLFVILFGLGVDFGIHLFSRYIEARKSNSTISGSIMIMFTSSGKASMTSAFTTAFVFFSLTLTNFKGFTEFGFIAGVGVITAMLAYFIVLPSLLIISEKLNILKPESIKNHNVSFKFLDRITFTKKSSIVIFSALTLFVAISLFGLFKLEFNYDFKDLRANLPDSNIVKERIGRIFPESFSPAIFLSSTLEEVDELREYFDDFIETDVDSPTIDKIRTIRDIVPKNQEKKKIIIAKIERVLSKTVIPNLKKKTDETSISRLKQLDKFLPYLKVKEKIVLEDTPEFYRNKFMNIDKTKYLSAVIPSVQLRDGKNAIAFSKDVTNIDVNGKTLSGGGSFVVFAEMLEVMIKNSKLAIILSFLSVFIVLIIDFKKISRVFIVSLPLLSGLISLSFIMFLADIKLNFFNIIVIPSVIGIGIDNGVHLYHRFLEEKGQHLKTIFINTGGAIFMTSLTTIIGFSGLAIAQHGGLNSIGKFAILGIGISFAATISMMPNLFNIIRRNRDKISR